MVKPPCKHRHAWLVMKALFHKVKLSWWRANLYVISHKNLLFLLKSPFEVLCFVDLRYWPIIHCQYSSGLIICIIIIMNVSLSVSHSFQLLSLPWHVPKLFSLPSKSFRSLAPVRVTQKSLNPKCDISPTNCRTMLIFRLIICNRIPYKNIELPHIIGKTDIRLLHNPMVDFNHQSSIAHFVIVAKDAEITITITIGNFYHYNSFS